MALAAATPVRASADLGESRVRAMLATNPIVKAGVAEAKRFSGAKACKYAIKTTQPREFEAGTTFDYSAEITCDGDAGESGAIVTVTGRLFKDGPQSLVLKIDFAG